MKLFIAIITLAISTNTWANLKIAEVKEMKKRSLAVFLVPESPQLVQKGTGDKKKDAEAKVVSVVQSLNNALNQIPSVWTLTSEVKVFDAGAINRIPDSEKNKWTILTVGTKQISDFNSTMSTHESTFTLTLTLADGKNVELYSNLVDLSLPFPLSVSENGTITVNEMMVMIKLIEAYLNECEKADKVFSIEDFGNKRAEINCAKLSTSKIILPEILRHSKVDREKYDEIKQVVFTSNQEFDNKLSNPETGEYLVISMPAAVSSASTGGTVSVGVSVLVTLQLILDVKTGDVVGCFRGNGYQTHPSWIRKAIKC